VSRFQPDESFDLGPVDSLEALAQACDPHRESDNLFYALRADGFFARMHTRAVKPAGAGTGLAAAAKTQPEFHFTDIEGTLVCLWSPRYSSSFSIPGYHFHFLSKDRTRGGHVLGCTTSALHVGMQTLYDYEVQLPQSGTFLKENLAIDTTAVLEKAE
jgi:acetolactate decarboxylase